MNQHLPKFSPGPWRYATQFIGEGKTVLVNGKPVLADGLEGSRSIYAADGLWVSESHGGNVGVDRDTCLANARLIAAAPLMFDALSVIGNREDLMRDADIRTIVVNALAVALGGALDAPE